jgi:short-subunit dehydrogenase
MTSPPHQHRSADRGRRRLTGLRALVTGGSSGVGRAVALDLARRGVHVLATARRTDRLAALASEPLPPGCPRIDTFPGDITQAEVRERLLARATEACGGLDILVAAAGGGAIGSFADSDPAVLRGIMELDFFAPAELTRAALPLLRRSDDPAVVFVGSILGLHPLPLHAEYCAAKAALRSLAAALREELAAEGIDVLLASLGPTETEFWGNLARGSRPPWSRGKSLSAAATAASIAVGLESRRTEILPGWQAKGYAFAARLCPWLIDAVVGRRMRSTARSSGTPSSDRT